MEMNLSTIQSVSLLKHPSTHNTSIHKSELTRLTRNNRTAWIHLDADVIQTRFRLKVLYLHFQTTEKPTLIQMKLRSVLADTNSYRSSVDYCEFFLIAQPHTDDSFYNITDYVQRCSEWDLSVAERLRGRTLLFIFQTEEVADDLLCASGVNSFIKRVFDRYIVTYGLDSVEGFAIEIPHFLSIFNREGSSIPWSNSLLKRIDIEIKRTEKVLENSIPYLFYETYNSPVIRSMYWQSLTTQFAECFLVGVREFCHEHKLSFAITIQDSSRSLQNDLGTLLEQSDCPILIASEDDTPRRFVVVKSTCSNANNVGIVRKTKHISSQYNKDASLGFNQWITKEVNDFPSNLERHYIFQHSLMNSTPVRKILMLSPIQSLWMKPEEKEWSSITKAWGWLTQTVWNIGYDFDIVSEAQFTKAIVNRNIRRICLNEKEYELVLLPSCLSLHETTVHLLTEFAKSKGRILANAPVPYLLNGKVGLEPYQLERLIFRRQTTVIDGPLNERVTELKKHLCKWIKPVISIYSDSENKPMANIIIHHRQHENGQLFFLYYSGNETIDALVEIETQVENIEECHLQTGKNVRMKTWYANDKTYLNCQFKPEQGRLLFVS